MKKVFEGHKVNFIIVGPIDKQSNHTIGEPSAPIFLFVLWQIN